MFDYDFVNENPIDQEKKSLEKVIDAFKEANYEIKNKFPVHSDYSMAQRIAQKMSEKLDDIKKEIEQEIILSNS